MLNGLIERDGELGRIDALLAGARAGNGGVLVVTGPAGIGKSSLLGEARERARLAGMRVLAGRGGELEGDFSFGVARQLFERLLTTVAQAERDALLAGAARLALAAMEDAGAAPSAVAAGDPPFAVVHGLYWLAVNASVAGPVLVAIDDLQWADQASLRFLLYLADRLAGLPVALVVTWRTGETSAAGTAADCLARTATGAMLQEVRGRLALASGDYPAARGELQAAAETYTALHQLSPGTCWRSALALALAGQDSGKALRLADSELEAARRTGSPRSAGIALRTRGMLQGGQRGLADLREAADVLRESDARLEHARALVEFGAALRAPTSAPRRASHCAQGWTSPTGAAQDGSPIGQQPNCELPAPGHGARC